MSQTIKVKIECKQTLHFNQEVEMSIEEYEKIKDLNFDDVTQRNEEEQYSILEGCINFQDVFDSDYEFTDVNIKAVSTK